MAVRPLLAGNLRVGQQPGRPRHRPKRAGAELMARTKAIGRRRPDRARDIQLYEAQLLAAAKTPREQAAVQWDRLRVDASRLAPGEEQALWRDVAALLANRRKQLRKEHGP